MYELISTPFVLPLYPGPASRMTVSFMFDVFEYVKIFNINKINRTKEYERTSTGDKEELR